MKPHYSEEFESIEISTNQAISTNNSSNRQPATNEPRQQPDRQQTPKLSAPLGDIAAIIALTIAFCTLLLLSLRAAPPSTVVQTFDMAPRPIWISTIPYAPRDLLVPDFGQSDVNRAIVTPLDGAANDRSSAQQRGVR
jgi:hypothetical protein